MVFTAEIKETLVRKVNIEARSPDEAWSIAEEKCNSGEINLDSNDFQHRDIEVLELALNSFQPENSSIRIVKAGVKTYPRGNKVLAIVGTYLDSKYKDCTYGDYISLSDDIKLLNSLCLACGLPEGAYTNPECLIGKNVVAVELYRPDYCDMVTLTYKPYRE